MAVEAVFDTHTLHGFAFKVLWGVSGSVHEIYHFGLYVFLADVVASTSSSFIIEKMP